MIDVDIPGRGSLHLEHLVLDLNGTLSLDGGLLPGVEEAVGDVAARLRVHLLSADTFGRLDALAASLGVPGVRLQPGEPEAQQKAAFIRQLGASSVVAIGNGANDAGMLREAAVGIAVLGPEGLALQALETADVVVASIGDAFGLLRSPRRLVATLRR